ncbi:MAG: hypothetical protein WC099_03085 [Candidatus Paceibacterota bacterium]
MPTSIFGIAIIFLSAILILGTAIFFIGAMSENSWCWREKRIKIGGITASISGVILVLVFLIFPNV